MIRNGDLPIQLPPLVRSGDDISYKLFNQLIVALKRLSDRTPVESSNGKRNTGAAMPFMPILKAEKGATDFTYKISLSSGYVVDRMITGDTTPIYHFPTGIVDEFDAIVWHDITDGQCVYVQVAVETDGTITTDPLVLIEADDLAGEHYRPEVFDFAGNAGEHNYKICKFEIVDGKPKLKLFCAGDNIDHYDERVTMRNLGTGGDGEIYEVGKNYDEESDTVEFRTLEQYTGDGVSIIKGYDEETQERIIFKRIREKETSAQIKVINTAGGNIIQVEGNGNSGSITHYDCDDSENGNELLRWEDGLITTNTATSFTAGCSDSGSGREIP